MKLAKLLKNVDFKIIKSSELSENIDNVEIEHLIFDSRKVKKNTLFVCINGAVSDGHQYIKDVILKGALVVIVQEGADYSSSLDGFDIPSEVAIIQVSDTRYTLALISAAFFDYPAEKLFTIGITGTKGKTTTAYMVRNILESCGVKTGLVGTIEIIIGQKATPANNTTPESYDIHEIFHKMVVSGCKAVVMEVSSQGLMLHRTSGINFDIGVFTNLAPDHIGPNEHASFEHYLASKALLFQQCKIGIVNEDDEHMDKMIENATCKIETYGTSEGADIRATNIELRREDGIPGIGYQVSGLVNMDIILRLPGKFNVYNSLCAIAVTRHFKIQEKALKKALLNVKVRGRFEIITVSDNYTLIIDFAHNAMALLNVLETLKEYNPRRIVCLFGCDGNRAKARRPEMGEVSGKYADFTVITSDNPRFEEPNAIIQDIIVGMKKTSGKYIAIADRKEAIRYVIENSEDGDVIILAGKGHENYQEIRGVKYPMDERVMIGQVLEELKNKESACTEI